MTEAAATTDQAAIDVRGIGKSFGRQTALDGVSFKVAPGRCLVMFGPNGAGKTTLIRLLSTLALPTAGTALICGSDIRSSALDVREIVGVISHESFLYDAMTAIENLRFYAKMYGADSSSERLEQSLEEVGLIERADDPVSSMSRGMTQRLALARCMLHGPRVLLLDEPYSGLDPHGAEILTRQIAELRERNCTIMLTTHRLDTGLEVADRVAILVRGRLSVHADRRDFTRDEFQREYTQAVAEGPS